MTFPTIGADARFVDHLDVHGRPNIVVDGPLLPGTALALSHWPVADCPPEFAADTSTGSVARYLDAAATGRAIDIVTNNHYDEDGILGLWLLLERPPAGDARRDLAIAAATAGDFRTWSDPRAAQVALALQAFAEGATTPFPGVLAALARSGARDPAGAICAAVLPRVGGLLDDPQRHARFWETPWARVLADRALVESGEAVIDDVPEVELAVVRTPRPLIPMALHPFTDRPRILTLCGDGTAFVAQRYETWVRFVSRELVPRRDLAALANELQARERAPGVWRFDGIAAPVPRLYFNVQRGGMGPTDISHEEIRTRVIAAFAA